MPVTSILKVTSILRVLAVAGAIMFAGAGAGAAGGADHRGSQGLAAWGKLPQDLRGCALGERRSPIEVRYVNPAMKLSPCSFNYDFILRNNFDNWRTIPVSYGSGLPPGSGK